MEAEKVVHTGLTVFDWAVISVVGLSGLLALFRGFVREVLSLAAWLIAAFVTVQCFAGASEMLKPHIASDTVRMLVAGGGLFFGTLIIAAIVNTIIIRFLNAGGDIGMLDSVLGMLFGVIRGLFVVALGFLMVTVVLTDEENYPDWLKHAKTRPVVEYSAGMLEKLAPKYVQEAKEITKESAKNAGDVKEMQEKLKELEELKKKKDPTGIDDAKRKDLERLLQQYEHDKGTDIKDAKKAKESL